MIAWLRRFARLGGNPFAFPLAALAALAMFLISESSYQDARRTFDMLGEQGATRIKIQTLLRSLLDVETGQRGYLLTSRPEYLEPYNAAQGRVRESIDWLSQHYRYTPVTRDLMASLARAADTRLAVSADTVKALSAGDATKARDLVQSDYGKQQMDKVRDLSEQLLRIENERVAAGRRDMNKTLLLNRIGVSAMTALSLLALYMYLRQSTVLVRQREEQRRLVQDERDQLEGESLRRTEQLTGLARHLERAREDERNRLARELHDELGAVLTAAKLDVARLKSRLGEVQPDVQERVKHLTDGLNNGIALKRRIIEDLRPSSLTNLGLVQALEILVSEWRQRSEIAVIAQLAPVKLRASAELTVYRLVQEALTNIAKYANASQVHVRLYGEGGRVHVSVRDDGEGFDAKAPRSKTHGLLGMEFRLETEGGALVIESSPGRGTLIASDLPESVDPGDQAQGADGGADDPLRGVA